MIFWFDANLSPQIARWVEQNFQVVCRHIDELGHRLSTDRTIFEAAKAAGDVVIVTKDADYVRLLERFGPPPAVLWLTTGNSSNDALRNPLPGAACEHLALFSGGEPLVEMG